MLCEGVTVVEVLLACDTSDTGVSDGGRWMSTDGGRETSVTMGGGPGVSSDDWRRKSRPIRKDSRRQLPRMCSNSCMYC